MPILFKKISIILVALVVALCLVFGFVADTQAAGIGSLEWSLPSCLKSQYSNLSDEEKKFINNGYLDVTLYNNCGYTVDPSGQKDSWRGIQQAVNDARDYTLAAYFPNKANGQRATYLISNQIRVVHISEPGTEKPSRVKVINIYGSTKGEGRPIIKLKKDSSGFGNPSRPKSIIFIGTQNLYGRGKWGGKPKPLPFPQNHAGGMNQSVRGIDIDAGEGNDGAIGLRFPAAQGSTIESVKVFSSAGDTFWAGFYNIPGAGGGVANIEVDGGRYGLHFGGDSDGVPDGLSTAGTCEGSIVVGVTFRNQTKAAIYVPNMGSPAKVVVGFDIIKAQEPAVVLKAPRDESGLDLLDGKIEITNSNNSPAIVNTWGKNFYIRNLYLKGSKKLIANESENPVSCSNNPGNWCLVKEYNHCDKNPDSGIDSYNLINGNRNQDETVNVQPDSNGPPGNLLSNHIWNESELPVFEDSDTVNAADFGAYGGLDSDGEQNTDDDYGAIMKAIKQAQGSSKKVFLPKGDYHLSQTLVLPADIKFFGVAKNLTRIYSLPGWAPTRETALISTVDDANSTNYLADLSVQPKFDPKRDNYFNDVHWRAGRNSIVKSLQRFWSNPDKLFVPRNKISDSGGGRWYFVMLAFGTHEDNQPSYRRILVENTQEPLSFYGLNLERSGTTPMAEIKNAKNVRIFVSKVESYGQGIYRVANSENVMLLGLGFNTGISKAGESHWHIINSNNILAANISRRTNYPPSLGTYMVCEENPSGTSGCDHFIEQKYMVSLYKKGVINDSVWDLDGAPSPTDPPPGATLTFGFKPEGMVNPPSLLGTKVTAIKDGQGTPQAITASYLTDGEYEGRISGLSPGTYTVIVKPERHLSEKFEGISITEGSNEYDFTDAQYGARFLAGDISGADGSPNNVVDVYDISLAVSDFDEEGDAADLTADVDYDGKVGGLDLTYIISSFDEEGKE